MYEIKSTSQKFDLTIPNCMYKIKPLCQNQCTGFQDGKDDVSGDYLGNFGAQIRRCLKVSLDTTDIEKRQGNLLKQLQTLRNQLMEIRSQSGVRITSVETKLGDENEICDDLVINANPDCIPYGILVLKTVWKDVYNINVTVHSHSSITNLKEEAKDFQNKITENGKTTQKNAYINIVLVWKDAEHTEMVTSSASYVPIYGEVNILRYFSRIGPIQYRYENDKTCSEMDAVLDICYQLPCSCDAKTHAQLLNSLNKHLHLLYSGGRNLNIVDIGAYSALRRSLWLKPKHLTENLIKWYENVNTLLSVVS